MLNRVARIFLNQPCPVCDRPTPQPFCSDCDRQLHTAFQRTSFQDTLLLEHSGPSDTDSSLSIVSLGTYEGALKRAILAMKYHNRPDSAYPLGIALAKVWQSQVQSKASQPEGHRRLGTSRQRLCVIPIPLHSERQQIRGYNQAERISAAFCRASGLLHVPQGLQRTRATQPQHSLTSDERQKNLEQVFQVGEALRQMLSKQRRPHVKPTVLLIDDIYTTGATAQSAVRALQTAGIAVVGIAVLARAGKPSRKSAQ